MSVSRLLNIGNLPTTAISDARLGNFRRYDGVVGFNILGSNDASDDEFADFEIHADFLSTFNDKISVRQKLGNDSGNIGGQCFRAVH